MSSFFIKAGHDYLHNAELLIETIEVVSKENAVFSSLACLDKIIPVITELLKKGVANSPAFPVFRYLVAVLAGRCTSTLVPRPGSEEMIIP